MMNLLEMRDLQTIQEANSCSYPAVVSVCELITRVITRAISGCGDMNNISLVDNISCQAYVL